MGRHPNHNDERPCTTNYNGVSQNLTKYDFAGSGALCNGNERRQTQTIVALVQGLEHHLRVPSQYMGGGLLVKGLKGCGLAMGRKELVERLIVFSLETLWTNSAQLKL